MYYIDPDLFVYIEQPDVAEHLEQWLDIWTETLHQKMLLGPLGSKIEHEVDIVGSQIRVRTTTKSLNETYEMRIGVKNFPYVGDPEFYTLHPENWFFPEDEQDFQ